MTEMLVVLAIWAAISLVVGLTVGRAIHQADSAAFRSRPTEWWVRPTDPSAETDGAPTDVEHPVHISHAA